MGGGRTWCAVEELDVVYVVVIVVFDFLRRGLMASILVLALRTTERKESRVMAASRQPEAGVLQLATDW